MVYISVIVPAYNCEKEIKRCLEAIKKSSYQDYELIVVDDGSNDSTASIANNYTDKIVVHNNNQGLGMAHVSGFNIAKGEIIVGVDSDVIIKSETLNKIMNYFSKHADIDALTGILSKKHTNFNFFSQYKNLYMHYIFKKMPKDVSFLYGSIFAVRRNVLGLYDFDNASSFRITDDTVFGQKLVSCGKRISLLKDLEVTHLKKYTLLSFLVNDFRISFDRTNVFIKYKGWKQLGKNKTGYAHSPKEQLISIILAPTIIIIFLTTTINGYHYCLKLFLISIWFFANINFITFLMKEKGIIFGILSIIVTFVDNIIMASGIVAGVIATTISAIHKR